MAPVSIRTLHLVYPNVVGIVAPMALPTVTIFTKRSHLLCFGFGKYNSGLYPLLNQMGGSISSSSPFSISSSGPAISARISYNSAGSESLPSKSSSPTSTKFSFSSGKASTTLTVEVF